MKMASNSIKKQRATPRQTKKNFCAVAMANDDDLPTFESMDMLPDGTHIFRNGRLCVRAIRIDSVHIEYECPVCWTSYKKNGEPTKRARRVVHRHGSNNEFHYRREHRVTHCARVDGSSQPWEVYIYVTKKTNGSKQ